ncbi:MAG TPA: mannose-1-phosphate guanylyltransferase/mannose-6-phosphate isomerase [Burkholderiales bacterium]|nr:mannose-1-phosphate guanylyltransferase/mannose-6-phosphate isomerase [Burkholderiales bacterium]
MIELGVTPTMIQPVILCGGSGTRLWPLSREHYPKQLHHLVGGDRTLLQETALRSRGVGAVIEPVVVCNEGHRFMVAEQLARAGAKPKAIVLEPAGRGTAPALTLAAIHCVNADDPVLLAMPSDHVVRDVAAFQKAVERGAALAHEGYIVTFGVPARSPQTGYGYIRSGRPIKGSPEAYFVDAFVEKPNAQVAETYVASGNYLWNAGIFAVRASVWIDAIGSLRKEILAACERSYRFGRRDGGFVRVDSAAFSESPSDSIDYAVMERLAEHAAYEAVVVPLDAGWSDVGAWDALWDIGEKDAAGNVTHGDVQAAETKNTLVIAQSRLVACVGLEDMVVVETPDAVMVARKDRAQAIGPMVAKLKAAGREECLAHRKVHRPWGTYDGIEKGERFQVKRIVVNPGASLSLQMHHHRAEHWIVVRGTARVTRGEETFLLTENESTYIPTGVRHRLENPGKLPLEIIEVQSGAYLGEDDIVRFEDTYGR